MAKILPQDRTGLRAGFASRTAGPFAEILGQTAPPTEKTESMGIALPERQNQLRSRSARWQLPNLRPLCVPSNRAMSGSAHWVTTDFSEREIYRELAGNRWGPEGESREFILLEFRFLFA